MHLLFCIGLLSHSTVNRLSLSMVFWATLGIFSNVVLVVCY